ncbi:MAG: putative transporter [Phycisphaerales bacterium]
MDWLSELHRTNPTAQAIGILAVVCMAGMVVGSVKFRGVGLGNSAVLFAGIVVGYFSPAVDETMLGFVKELGLMLFVFCIGLQLGPGFFASFRQVGLRLNLLAAAIVVLGALAAVGAGRVLGVDVAAVPGLFAGATTNTPSLGAAQQTLAQMPDVSSERAALPALAYAVSYPVAIASLLGTLVLLKLAFRIDPQKEAEAIAKSQLDAVDPVQRRTLVIDNPNLEGCAIADIPALNELGVRVSRLRRANEREVRAASPKEQLHRGDQILAVGTARALNQCQWIVGSASSEDLLQAPGSVRNQRVVVTNRAVLGQSVQELGLEQEFGVTVTRVSRAGIEMTAVPNLRLQFGDMLQIVGNEGEITKAARRLGNSLKALNETHFVPLFAGLVAGIVLGTLPIPIPGVPQPIRLGLAGGPLLVAILVSRVGRIGPLVWHMPLGANIAFRELGIALFFAAVGLTVGPHFFATVLSSNGLVWMAAGACVTVLPVLAVGAFALATQRMGFVTVAGFLAGSMTDPPALAFANNLCGSEAPTVAYATVYPLTTLMRIVAAQALVVFLCR